MVKGKKSDDAGKQYEGIRLEHGVQEWCVLSSPLHCWSSIVMQERYNPR